MRWASEKSVIVRLRSEERCMFLKEVQRKVEALNAPQNFKKYSLSPPSQYWVDYELLILKGSDCDEKITLLKNKSSAQLMTSVKATPKPEISVPPSLDVSLTFLVQYFRNIFSVPSGHDLATSAMDNVDVFVPVLPFFERVSNEPRGDPKGLMVSLGK
eukprot:TRINITY_DN9324_c0_g2_i1.p1 TRINITY_DN9324_c0_g2~~TRINITY_DN9324_c0_g2_i1.p1  ORF type:complete len:158 (-),score=34.97 TRINITY_DN9324_c0_g2_i1:405-878(-)